MKFLKYKKEQWIWILLRIGMSWIFLWPFLDKLFGLGFATAKDSSWLSGTSPTAGFLQHATKGPFAGFYQSLTGSILVDWIFMIGILLIGVSLLLGICVKISGYSGALLFFLMYTAGFIPPEHNPFLDEHIIYLVIMIGLTFVKAGHWLGLGKWWSQQELVKKYPILE
ncbi:MAG: hypothetical protein ACE5DM_01595 [Candidatus Nanoarchaeia archaeon]